MAQATKVELQEALKKLGVTLTGDENVADLKAMLADAEAAAGDNGAGDGDEEENKPVKKNLKGGIFVWLKQKSYFDTDGEQRMGAGLFHFESLEAYPRFEKMGSDSIETFEGEIPSMKLAQIAKWSGVNPDKYRKSDSELLDILVTEPSIF